MERIARHLAAVDQEILKLDNFVPQVVPDDDEASQEWMHILATIDTCALPSVTHFCDEEGYDVVPIREITPIYNIDPTPTDAILTTNPLAPDHDSSEKEFSYYLMEEFSDDDPIVLDAQAEAKLRAQKNKDRRRYINCITISDFEVDYDPPLLIRLSANGHNLVALIDSRADANVLSYEASQKLQ